MTKSIPSSDSSFLFQVEVMINSPSNGEALEQLLHVLNSGKFADYRIGSGIQLGATIEQALADTPKIRASLAAKDPAKPSSKEPTKSSVKAHSQADPLEIRIRHYIQSNQLIRLNVNKGRGIKMSIPCRVINFESSSQLLTVYHVDEKQVYTIRMNEIDDFIE